MAISICVITLNRKECQRIYSCYLNDGSKNIVANSFNKSKATQLNYIDYDLVRNSYNFNRIQLLLACVQESIDICLS